MKNTHPTINLSQLKTQYHPTLNTYKSNEVRMGSNKLIWWRCKLNHQYQKTPKQMSPTKENCPYCNGVKLLSGFNDLATKTPKLAKEWSNKNLLKPENYYYKSNKKVWWRCKLEHEWEATINSRQVRINNKSGEKTMGNNCPYCANQKTLIGFNDLKTLFPKIAKEYSQTLNKAPVEAHTPGSNSEVWWNCANHHSYKCTVSARTNRGRGCPYCSNQKVFKGYNDLKTYTEKTNKTKLLEEWDHNKNTIKPDEIYYGSKNKIWWRCNNNHSWKTSLKLRSLRNYNCPKCHQPTSQEELKVITHLLPNATPANLPIIFRSKKQTQVDGKYRNIIIEYDGSYWHMEVEQQIKDEEKTRLLLHNSYKIIRVRNNLPPITINHPNYLELPIKNLNPGTLREAKKKLNKWLLEKT